MQRDLFALRRAQHLSGLHCERGVYRSAAGSVFDALTSKGGGGLGDFFSGQLKTIERQVFVNFAGETFNQFRKSGIGDLIPGQKDGKGDLTFIGRLLAGTPFATQDKAIGFAKRTADATEAIAGAMTGTSSIPGVGSLVPGMIGVTSSDLLKYGSDVNGITGKLGIGKGSSGSYSGLSGVLGGLAFTGDLRGIATGIHSDKNGAQTLSNSERAGAAIGTAGVLVGGYEGVSAGIKQGGAKGGLNAVSSAAATALALDFDPTGISQAVLGAVALGSHIVASILGDPKTLRQAALNKFVTDNQSKLNDSITRDVDISGNEVDYDSAGRTRTITIIKQTNNVNAIDTKSISDHWEPIADAMKMALDLNHPVTDTIRQGLPG